MDKNCYGMAAKIMSEARRKRKRIGIVVFQTNNDVVKHLRLADRIAKVVVIGKKIKGLESYAISDPEVAGKRVINMLDNKEIDGLVRGQLHPRPLMLPLCKRLGSELKYFDGSMRINPFTFEHRKTHRFFILCGVDLMSGISYPQKRREVLTMVKHVKEIGLTPNVALMAMRRSKPKNAKPIKGLREFPIIEESYGYAEKIFSELKRKKIKAGMYNIEYETAIKAGANIVVPPIGPVGNAFGRSLMFFSENWQLIRSQALMFRPYNIEDGYKTSNGKDFYWNIISAAATANARKPH